MKNNVPIDGLGIQAHEPRDDWYAPTTVWNALNEMGETGLPLHITELMLHSSGREITGGYKTSTWGDKNDRCRHGISYFVFWPSRCGEFKLLGE